MHVIVHWSNPQLLLNKNMFFLKEKKGAPAAPN
jgi:hypothetical protein